MKFFARLLTPFLFFSLAAAQQTAPQQQPQSKPQAQTPQPGPKQTAPAKEHTITPAEAEELFRSVDEISGFVSRNTGLPQKRAVKRQIAKRDTVEKLIRDRLQEDDNLERFKRSEVVLKKFGLIPRDFDLEAFLIRLMREQAAGFYNFRDQTVYLLDWIEEEAQKPVLAHELMHALQDQSVDVENWLDGLPVGTSKEERKRLRNEDLEQPDDQMAARQAVLEGQGMTVMLDYLLAPSGNTIVEAPQVVAMFEAATMAESDKSPELSAAPVFIKEWLVFPYTQGMRFVHQVLTQKGKDGAYAALLEKPPGTTLHVMYPELFLAGIDIPEMKLPDVRGALGDEWALIDTGAMGAFDVSAMAAQFADETARDELTPGWRGGRYWAARRVAKGTPGGGDSAATLTTNDVALLYVSKWKDAASAAKFAEAYAAWLPQRYGKATATNDDCKCVWTTDEGKTLIVREGEMVIALESFDDETAARLRTAMMAATK